MKVFYAAAKNISNLNPHFVTLKASNINYQYLFDIGLRKIIFDKDHTLTPLNSYRFIDQDTEVAIKKAKDIFGKENLTILTNHPGTRGLYLYFLFNE